MITMGKKDYQHGWRPPRQREGGRVSLVHQHQARGFGAGSNNPWYR